MALGREVTLAGHSAQRLDVFPDRFRCEFDMICFAADGDAMVKYREKGWLAKQVPALYGPEYKFVEGEAGQNARRSDQSCGKSLGRLVVP